ncbi:TetR family transcriptional regulator [Paenibacillus sp. CN-4]|uniref:TetR family transcriptional regulator n=1 Tax=Paenibacillus nanchangensis TaxID=3348343 RepID=UPI00397A0FBC
MPNDAPLTKEAILDAAEETLRRYGPDKTSVVDVAKALGVSHGTLYRHFASKAALREAVTERWLHRSIVGPLKALQPEKAGAKAKLRLWLNTLTQLKRDCAAEDPEMFAMYTAVSLEAGELIAAHVRELTNQIAGILREGRENGEFKFKEAERTAQALFIATSRFHHPVHAREWLDPQIEQQVEAVWELLLSGLSAR